MSMSLARLAMPSSRMCAPSLTSAYTRRCTISSSVILRGVMPSSLRCVVDHLVDHRGRDRVALAGLVVVPAGAGLLAEAAQLAQLVGRACCSACRASRRSGACGSPSRCRCRPGRPCGTGPSRSRTSRSRCRPAAACAPSSSRKPAWREYCSIMRLPMKPSQTPETTAVFLIFLASAITVASTSLRGLARRARPRAASSRWPG